MKIHHATIAKAKKFGITLSIEENEVIATGKTGVRLASGLQGNKVLEDAITKQTGKPAKGKGNTPVTKADLPQLAAKVAKAIAPIVASLQLMKTNETDTQIVQSWAIETVGGKTFQFTTRTEIGEMEFTGRRLDHQFKMPDGSMTTGREIIEQAISGEIELVSDGDRYDFSEENNGEDDGEAQSKSIVKAKYRALYKPHKDRSGDDLSHTINKHVSREDDAGEMKINLDALRKFAKANGVWVEAYASLRNRTGGFNGGMAIMNCNNRLRAKIRQAKKAGEEFQIKWV